MAIRVQKNPEDFGRCGCGRRDYCDGSHSLSEAQWQAVQAKERAQASPDQGSNEAGEDSVDHLASQAVG